MSFFGQQNSNQQQGTGFGSFGANNNTTPTTGKQNTVLLSSSFIPLSPSQSEFSSLPESNPDMGPRLGFGQPPQNTGFGSSSNNAGGGLFGGTTTGFGTGGKSRSSVLFQTHRRYNAELLCYF